jgi:high-affinity Fe2+/Pb2+ permease
MNRPTRRRVGWGLAAGLACAACCAIELGLLGGLSALGIGAEFTEFAFLAPLLALGVLAAATVMLVRRRRNRIRTPQAVLLPISQVRHDTSDPKPAAHSRAG